MRCVPGYSIAFVLCAILFKLPVVDSRSDSLYDILGVDRTATARTIKQAYKQLAREWHPDKNKSPDANERFMKINEAYETLSDPQKREHYDTYGTTSARAEGHEGHHGNPFEGFSFHFGNGGGPFRFHFQDQASFDTKYKINLWTYQNTLLKESATRPYLIYICSSFYFQCMQMAPIWASFIEDLEKIGAGIAVVDADSSPGIMESLKVKAIPSIIGVVGGRHVQFKRNFGIKNLREFVRDLLPPNDVTMLTRDSFKGFISGWSDNKVKVVMFDTRAQPCLRLLMAAFERRTRFKFGYYHVESTNAMDPVIKRYRINTREETFLVFKEDDEAPVAQISAKSISREEMDRLMDDNAYLHLPRVSDPQMFDHLCPLSIQSKSKRICILLMLGGSRSEAADRPFLSSFRSASRRFEDSGWSRVSFGYLYEDAQVDLVGSLRDEDRKNGSSPEERRVIILWRHSKSGLRYANLPRGWREDSGEDNEGRLSDALTSCLSAPVFGRGLGRLPEIVDEFAEGIFWVYLRWCSDMVDQLYNMASQDEVMLLMFIMAISTVVFIFGMLRTVRPSRPVGGLGPTGSSGSLPDDPDGGDSLSSRSEETTNESGFSDGQCSSSTTSRSSVTSRTCIMEELTEVSYEGLVSVGRKGWRSIILFVGADSDCKDLLGRFKGIVGAYSGPHYRFRFAYLQLTRSATTWCRRVASASSPLDTSALSLTSPRIGMVMVVNPANRCYHLFFPDRVQPPSQQPKTKKNKPGLGEFLGFEEGESAGEGLPLDGFDAWLERLCDGLLSAKVHISDWPEGMN